MRGAAGDVRSPFVTVYNYMSFLTDYGLEDGFVAACHGAAARIAPTARIIDITHLVQPGDVRRGAAVLAQTVPLPAARRARGRGRPRRRHRPPGRRRGGRRQHPGRPGQRPAVLGRRRAGRRPAGPSSSPTASCGCTRSRRRSTGGTSSCRWPRTWPPGRTWPRPATRSAWPTWSPCPRRPAGCTTARPRARSCRSTGSATCSCPSRRRTSDGSASASAPRWWSGAGRRQFTVPYLDTFAAGAPGEIVAFTDSAGLISLAINAGDAAEQLGLPPGAHVRLSVARLPDAAAGSGRRIFGRSAQQYVTCLKMAQCGGTPRKARTACR